MTATMHEMSTTMQSVATNTQKQALSVAETSSSIEQMMGSIQTVAEYARGLLTISQKSRDAVAGGSDAVGKASGGMNEINSVIQKAEQIISSLGGKTEDMARIVEVIDDISEQTNLLALNAAIEAARAGEQGLGFAVVADEVRKLAERSALSTREIAELIQSVAREGKSAVDNMNRSSSMVQHGLRFTKEVIEALEGIRAAVDGLSQYADHIGVATQEQSKGSDQIRKSVAALNDAIHEISSASEQQSLGASQVVQAIERVKDMVHQSASGAVQLASSAEQLNQQAGNLQSLVDKFSLNGHAPAASLVKAA
jgi:methyl-accepting chemotaxis protein